MLRLLGFFFQGHRAHINSPKLKKLALTQVYSKIERFHRLLRGELK